MINPKTMYIAETELDRLNQLPANFKYASAGIDGVNFISDGQVCYASVGGRWPDGKNEVFIDSSVTPIYNLRFYKSNIYTFTDEIVIRYIKWLSRKSIFAKAFVSQDAEDMQQRGAIFDAKYPAYYVISAATALRYISENPEIVAVWDIFRKYINYNQAFYLAHFFKLEKTINAIVGVRWGCSSANSNHILPPPRNIDISNQTPCRDRGDPMSECSDYRGLGKIWDADPIKHFYMLNKISAPISCAKKINSFGKQIVLPYYPLDTIAEVLHDTVKINSAIGEGVNYGERKNDDAVELHRRYD